MRKLPATSAPTDPITAARRLALTQLLEAHDVAQETGRVPWTYACQYPTLQAQGISDTALRWLVDQQLAEHRLETTKQIASRRTFKPSPNGHLSPASCFCLTAAGIIMAQLNYEEDSGQRTENREQDPSRLSPPHLFTSSPLHLFTSSPLQSPIPLYDSARRTLFFRGQIVKQFRQPAANQELILTAFQEENWPPRIDDPLPPALEIDPKKRLGDAVFRLNKRQKKRSIVFECDGTGQGVQWRERSVRGA